MIKVDVTDDVDFDYFYGHGGITLFQGRKRNLDLTGTRQEKRDGSSHGISWESVQQRRAVNEDPYHDVREIESGWEENEEEDFKQNPPKGRSRRAFIEQQSIHKASSTQLETSYPVLRKKPDFNEQNKKLTIYMDKELMKTMESLKKDRYIASYSWLVSEAVRFYLQEQGNQK